MINDATPAANKVRVCVCAQCVCGAVKRVCVKCAVVRGVRSMRGVGGVAVRVRGKPNLFNRQNVTRSTLFHHHAQQRMTMSELEEPVCSRPRFASTGDARLPEPKPPAAEGRTLLRNRVRSSGINPQPP